MKKLLLSLSIVFFCSLIACSEEQIDNAVGNGNVEGSISDKSSDKKSKANTRTVAGENAEVERVAKPKWRQICILSGKKNKKSKPFKITGKEWKIQWDVKQGAKKDAEFILILHSKQDKNDTEIITTQIGPGEDFEIYEGGKGEYYLDINSSAPYQIEILEYK